jgi:hypothetical protein
MSDWSSLIPAAVLLGAAYWGWRALRAGADDSAPPPGSAAAAERPPAPPPVPVGRPVRPRPMEWRERRVPHVIAAPRVGLCDGLTGAVLDRTQPLWRCTRCLTCYQDESRRALQEENGGGCLACNGTDLQRLAPEHTPSTAAGTGLTDEAPAEGPVAVTAKVWWLGPAAEPGFCVVVLENRSWREALKLIFPPALTAQRGAVAAIAALAGRAVVVDGHLTTGGPLGPRIVVTDRRSLRPTAIPASTPLLQVDRK